MDDAVWEKIELSERYLVSGMFQEAESLSFSIIQQLVPKQSVEINNCELCDMLESAGMVFVQSLKQLGRTSQILKQLKVLFGSVTNIPAQVFLTGVCLQIPDGPSSEVQEILEEFLLKWRYVDGLENVEAAVSDAGESHNQIPLRKYVEIVELYVVTLLGRIQGNLDLAISWVEKASLPEEKRQDLLRQLHSMNTLKLGSSRQQLQVDDCTTESAFPVEEGSCNGTAKAFDCQDQSKGENMKRAIMEFSRQKTPFWWFRTVTLKFGSSRLVLSNGSIFLSFLAALVFYIVRRKQAHLWSGLKRRALSTRKALVDFWQLAFSYQVNPLAAVQPLPPASRGSR